MEPIVGLLLAAGSSRRFGSDKLQQGLHDGEALVAASARRLRAGTDRAIVLIRGQQPALRSVLADLAVEIVEVANAEQGMGTTLAAGVRTAPAAAGWVVALGDMPCIAQETIVRVTAALRAGASIAAPYYQGERGHPVGFARSCFESLAALDGDEGARALLRVQDKSILRIDVEDPGCRFDVDRPADLQGLLATGATTPGK